MTLSSRRQCFERCTDTTVAPRPTQQHDRSNVELRRTPRPPETTVTSAETTTTDQVDLVALGESLAARNGCTACHSPDGSPLTGPTWQGLYGTEETLYDGSTVLVDDAYPEESIIDPNIEIVDGYTANIMPQDFGDRLSEDDIAAIIAYIKSLG